MNKVLATAFFVGFSFVLLAGEQGEKIDFFRPAETGRTCHVKASIRSSCRFSVRSSAAAKAPEKLEESAASIAGVMKVLECSDKGNPLAFEFAVESFSGNSHGNAVNSKVLAGKTLLVKKTLSNVSFSLVGGGDIPVPDEDLLRMLFQPDDGLCLKDIIGTDNPLKTGDSWTLSHDAKDGISFSGTASLKNKEKFSETECWRIEYTISASDAKGLASEASTEILLPVEKKKGGPLRIKSKQKRKIEKALPAENPITAGSILNIDESVEFHAEVVPLS